MRVVLLLLALFVCVVQSTFPPPFVAGGDATVTFRDPMGQPTGGSQTRAVLFIFDATSTTACFQVIPGHQAIVAGHDAAGNVVGFAESTPGVSFAYLDVTGKEDVSFLDYGNGDPLAGAYKVPKGPQ